MLTLEHHKRVWELHKVLYKLKFSAEEEIVRFKYFQSNGDFIFHHNSTNTRSHKCHHNKLSHLSHEEYKAWLTLRKPILHSDLIKYENDHSSKVPLFVDWRSKGVVTRVKNQEQCGSCWAFSTVGGVESCVAIATGNLVELSEQQLIDCSTENHGCNGGLPSLGLEYVQKVGLAKESDYPYNGVKGPPMSLDRFTLTKIGGQRRIESNEKALAEAVSSQGPVCVGIDASQRSFQFYHSGVYYEPAASSKNLDHAVLCVGFGTMNDNDYWIVKNSWGTTWGSNGYVYMSRNRDNNCGIATNTTVPIPV